MTVGLALVSAGGVSTSPHPVAETPVTAVVLVDASWSTANVMAPFVWDGSRDSHGQIDFASGRRLPHRPADLFLPGITGGLLPSLVQGDRIRFASFGRTFRMNSRFVTDRNDMPRAAREALDVSDDERYGPSPLWDALLECIEALAAEPSPRVAIAVTDGLTTGNRTGLAALERRAVEARVTIYVVHQTQRWVGRAFRLRDGSGNPWAFLTNPLGRRPEAMLRQLAEATGGLYLADESPSGAYVRDTRDGRDYPDPNRSRARSLGPLLQEVAEHINAARSP
ncbi:MAG TPA: vWA domain-containing protein, partial [Vicinamibacterales bacterium]|nr:vWA domain-containing protein [Vicinamibacterales bacterium]